MKKALVGLELLFFCIFSSGAAERMTVALLNPRNASGNTNAEHWQYAISLLMGSQLSQVKSIRLLPYSSIYYAVRQLKLKEGRTISADQARKLGEIIEARRVIWSEYSKKGTNYTLTMWVMNVASGKVSKKLTAAGPDWFQVVSNSVNSILHELAVTPTADEEARMNHPPTRSAGALELFALGYAKNKVNGPLAEAESLLRKSASMDPAFPTPLEGLAKLILFMGQDSADEAEQTAEQAVNLRPDYAAPHNVLGMIYEFKGMNYIARDELVQAVRLNPDDPDNFDRLGEIYGRMGRIANAVTNFNEAARLAPFDSAPHAHLGETYAALGNRDAALQELKIAEQFNPGDDPEVDQRLADVYLRLNDAPHYVAHTEKFLAAAKQVGAQNPLLLEAETNLAHWKASLTPHFITATAPRDYSSMELDAALKAKLTAAEFQSVTNPLSSTVEMKKWAVELTAGATGEQEKARRLFDGLSHHLDVGSTIGRRTAVQTFQIWKETNINLTCMDYAFLYVTLARDAGLKAYFTVIDKDYSGSPVMHACACVFVGGKGLLADPAYNWFGAPHQQYELLDDYQVIGGFLCQLPDLESKRMAVKLRPDFAMAHFNLAMALAGSKQLRRARRQLAEGLALESGSPLALLAQGAVEANSQDFVPAAEHFQQCLDLEPGLGEARFGLAMVLEAQGKHLEAREEFRKYLQGYTEPEKADLARKALAKLDEDSANSTGQSPSAAQPGADGK